MRGDLVSRAEVRREVSEVVQMFASMAKTESRRVLELCPGLSAEQRSVVSAALDRVQQGRALVLRKVGQLRSDEELELELEGAMR